MSAHSIADWPEGAELRTSGPFRDELLGLAHGAATSLLFELPAARFPEVANALQAPLTEFVRLAFPRST